MRKIDADALRLVIDQLPTNPITHEIYKEDVIRAILDAKTIVEESEEEE